MPQASPPFFSICIPQYNRTSFLLEALRSLQNQTFQDFEICISDDCSPDGRGPEIVKFLEQSGMAFRYVRQPKNLRYDGNLRAAVTLATGQFCVLMGNDDALVPHALERIGQLLQNNPRAGVLVTNYRGEIDGVLYSRCSETRVLEGTPELAASRFRNLAFVSGVTIRRDRVQAHVTTKWDGSEMYQMYLGSRIVAEGYQLVEVAEVLVRMGLQIAGESVDSYAKRPRETSFKEQRIPLVRMGRLVYDAIAGVMDRDARPLGEHIFRQILRFTYPFWIFEYRRANSWLYSAGVCYAMRPSQLLGGEALTFGAHVRLRATYYLVTTIGLLAPVGLFRAARPLAYRLAKRSR